MMSRPNDATEPFIAESEVSGADANERQQQRRQRRQIQQERRRAFRDRHFQDGKQQEFGFKPCGDCHPQDGQTHEFSRFRVQKVGISSTKVGNSKKETTLLLTNGTALST